MKITNEHLVGFWYGWLFFGITCVVTVVLMLLVGGCTTTTFERPDGMRFSRTRLLQTESLHDVIVTDPCGVSVSMGSQSGDVSANGVELVIRGVEVVK